MCEPLTILTIASAAAGAVAQNQQAKYQTKQNERQYQNTVVTANANQAQVNLEQSQQRDASMQKLDENNMAARAAKSTATVSAGENGISGLSVDALLADIGTKQQRYNSSVVTNYDSTTSALDNQRQNITSNANSQINSLKTPAMPDYMGAALRIGGSAYGDKVLGPLLRNQK